MKQQREVEKERGENKNKEKGRQSCCIEMQQQHKIDAASEVLLKNVKKFSFLRKFDSLFFRSKFHSTPFSPLRSFQKFSSLLALQSPPTENSINKEQTKRGERGLKKRGATRGENT